MIRKSELLEACSILGIATDQAQAAVKAAGEGQDGKDLEAQFIEEFSCAVQQAESAYSADWREDPFELLFYCVNLAKANGADIDLEPNKGKAILDLGPGGYFIWKGGRKHDAYMAGWNRVAAQHLVGMRVPYWDASDTALYVLLVPELWDRLRGLFGPLFDRLFTSPSGKGEFTPKKRPKPKKIDWNKKYLENLTGNLLAVEALEWTPELLGTSKFRSLNLSLQVPPIGPETETQYRETVAEARQCSEAWEFRVPPPPEPRIPYRRWFIERDTRDLATWLYARALFTHLQLLWELYYWSYQPAGKGTFRPRMNLFGEVRPAWAWFIFDALGCDDEAARLGPLLEEPAFAGQHHGVKDRDLGWSGLARLLANGVRTADLVYVDRIMPLMDPAAWSNRDVLERALRAHIQPQADMCTSDGTLYQCWPAPLYSLARRAGVESLPKDNPYLALRVSRDEIRRDLPLVERANQAIEAFGNLERSQFRAFRPEGMIPSSQAELREKMKDLREGDWVTSCQHCNSIYRVWFEEGPASLVLHCQQCGHHFSGSNKALGFECLIKGEVGKL